MKHPHINTGKGGGRHRHIDSSDDPRFYINTAPGAMEPKYGLNEAHGSHLERHQVVELRDELNDWLRENPTPEEKVRTILAEGASEAAIQRIVELVERERR